MKVLILFPRVIWQRRMAMDRRHSILEMMSRDSRTLRVQLSGVGWPTYHEEWPLWRNIESLGGADYIWWYKPQGVDKHGVSAIREPGRKHAKSFQIFNECWWPNRLAERESLEVGDSFAVLRHLVDRKQFRQVPTHYIRHCASESLFVRQAKPFAERQHSLVVTGCLSDAVYPLRMRVARLIQQKQVPGMVLEHPGYRLASETACHLQEQKYAELLGDTKISLCDASIYNYGLNKYTESWMAGCAVAGEVPPDYGDMSDLFACRLSADMSTADLVARLTDATQRDLAPLAAQSQEVARRCMTMRHWVDELIRVLEADYASA